MKFGSIEFFKALIKASLVILPVCLILLLAVSISFFVYYRNTTETIRDLETKIEQIEEMKAENNSDTSLSVQQNNLTEKKITKYFETIIGSHSNNMASLAYEYDKPLFSSGMSAEKEVNGVSEFDYLPDFQQPRIEINEPPSAKTAYLTFDDGPSQVTLDILETLDDYGIKATFFVISRRGEEEKRILREIVKRGHNIGMHSDSHDPQKIYQSVEEYLSDLYANYLYIKEVTGQYSQIYRFIGGSKSKYNNVAAEDIIAAMDERGFSYFDWNSSAEDAVKPHPDAAQIVKNVMKTAGKQQLVVLSHDSSARKQTAEALPAIIEGLLARGYEFGQLDPSVHPVRFTPYKKE